MEAQGVPRVLIVGAGFAGLQAARALARQPVEVLLVDRENYHTFLPLLYQIAAAELEPEDIAYPVRSILWRLPNVHFSMGEVIRLDTTRRLLETSGRIIPFDYLVLATGSISHFFGIPGAAESAFALKTLEQGIALRNHILCCFERAVYEPDRERRSRMLTFTIVGGGPTGVEYAGALAELIRGPLRKDYPTLDVRDIRLVLLEAMPELLFGLPGRLRGYTLGRLRGMGVDVRTNAKAARIAPDAVYLDDGTVIATQTIAWTAGVRGDPMAQTWGLPIARSGRVTVLPTLQVAGHPEVYAVGDIAYLEEGGHPLPMIAPVAIQQGRMAAQNILRQIGGHEPLPFHYSDPGTMVTIGRNIGVVSLHGRTFVGFPAWLLWLGVHLFKLIGFRNRLLVLINWAWDYLLFERAVRLILPREVASASGVLRCGVRSATGEEVAHLKGEPES